MDDPAYSDYPLTDMLKVGDFRSQLLGTLRAIKPVLEEVGVMVAGSEVPNLLEPGARSTLVVSQDVDIAVPVSRHAGVKRRLREVQDLMPSADEPSVWVPMRAGLIEVNFIGMDRETERAGETYVFDDTEMPLLVFGHLGFLSPGEPVFAEDLVIPVPRPAGLLLEKLVTDRSGEKGDRDLLVVLGLALVAKPEDFDELEDLYRQLSKDLQYSVRSNLTLLSLLQRRNGMPDPTLHRRLVADLLTRLEGAQAEP